MKKTVDVSILATNYNNEKYLDNFFKSIIDSTVKPKEIVFLDDGSTDNSLEVIEKYKYLENLKLIIFEKNKGRAEALNEAKKNCSAKYVLIIDPDDIMLPYRIEKQFNFMEHNSKIDACGANVMYFNDKTNKDIVKSNFPTKNILQSYKNGDNGLLHATIIIKNNVFSKYNYKQIMPGEDYELFSRIINDGYKFANQKDIVDRVRIHPASSVSSIKYKSIKKIFDCRDEIFNKKTYSVKILFYYLYLKNYRRGMLKENKISKYFYYAIAIFFNPRKIIARILK